MSWIRTEPVDDTVTVTAHGKSYRMEAQPGKITRTIRQTGRPYEWPLLERIYQMSFDGMAVDAGANFGNHTLWMAVVCGLEVAAFEPIQHQVLTRNIEMNDANATPYAVALGDAPTTAKHVAKGTLDSNQPGDITVVTLDSMELTGVSVIKADVEDMEPHVLRGGEETIRRDRPVIFAETHDGRHAAIAGVLEPWGYQMVDTLNARESLTPVAQWMP